MLRVHFIFIFFLLLLFAGPVLVSSSTEEVTVHIDKLNVRSGPGTQYEKIGQLREGAVYPVEQVEGEWVNIRFHGRKGWISKEYTSITHDDEADQAEKRSVTIPQNNTQFRDSPSTDGNIIHFADEGDIFSVTAVKKAWYKAENKDVSGYVQKQLVAEQAESPAHPLQDKTIVIDAGHGGEDTGAIGANGFLEKDITYLTALEIKQKLSSLGANVLFTRQEDVYISLQARAGFTNAADADAFISIHYNSAAETAQASGIGTYYYGMENKKLAQIVQEEILKQTGGIDRDFAYGDFQVLRQNVIPAVLVELGFISHPAEELLLSTHGYRKNLAVGVVNGLAQYFRLNE